MDAIPDKHELDIKVSNEHELVQSGQELADKLEIPSSESVLVALFPEQVHEIKLTEEWIPWGSKARYQAKGIVGNWMSQTRLLDLLTPRDARWWHVEKFAQKFGYSLVPVRWRGKLRDIPLNYFTPGMITGIRFYRHGPWFWPLQKPEIKEAPSEVEKALEAIPALNT